MFGVTITIMNVYRSFRPPGMISPDAFFIAQLGIIKNALNNNCYLILSTVIRTLRSAVDFKIISKSVKMGRKCTTIRHTDPHVGYGLLESMAGRSVDNLSSSTGNLIVYVFEFLNYFD